MRTSLNRTLPWIAASMSTALLAAQGHAQSADDSGDIATVLITAQRAERVSRGATGLDLAIRETPQSISVVTSAQMEDFGADDLNDALRLATGITVEEWETNRTNFMARGFEIKNTQVDGVGLPNDWGIVTGAMDAAGYEKLEVIRGANGLLTGVGNSSGTINYVRKRPTNDRQARIDLTGGSFDRRRIEADYSTPFTSSGAWAGRLVVAAEEKDSWVRGLENDRTYLYGVIDGQVGERSTIAAGYSFQDANTDGNMWGALVLANADGTQAEFPRSSSTSLDWTYWDTKNHLAFAEYTYALPSDWTLKLTYNFRSFEDDDEMFFAYSMTGLAPDGTGMWGNPGSYRTDDDSHLVDLTTSGRFSLFGREHEAIVGLNYSTGERTLRSRPVPEDAAAWGELPPFPYPGDAFPEPAWGELQPYSDMEHSLERFYGAGRFAVTDKLHAIVGFNLAEYSRKGVTGSAVAFDESEREMSPYAGITYDLRDNLLAYASYSDIYQPQDLYDADGNYLPSSKGMNYEVGLKAGWLDDRLLTTLAWFTAKQKDLGTYAGMDNDGMYFYQPVDFDSKGYELEIAGRIGDRYDVVFGFTTLEMDGAEGKDTNSWVPRQMANFAVSAKLPGRFGISLGLSGRWQSHISKVDEYTGVRIHQDAYAVLNAFARWAVTDNLDLRVNANNLTDEKYITSLYQIGYYAAPLNWSATVGYRF